MHAVHTITDSRLAKAGASRIDFTVADRSQANGHDFGLKFVTLGRTVDTKFA